MQMAKWILMHAQVLIFNDKLTSAILAICFFSLLILCCKLNLCAVRSLSPPTSVEPSGPPHPKSYMEVYLSSGLLFHCDI